MYMYAYIIPNQGHILVSKGGLTRNDLYSSYLGLKSLQYKSEGIELILSFSNRIIQI